MQTLILVEFEPENSAEPLTLVPALDVSFVSSARKKIDCTAC